MNSKRFLDYTISLFLLPWALLFLGVIAVVVKWTSPGPVFFRQERLGRGGIPFVMWKVRTMVADAEAQRALLHVRNQATGFLFKLDEDPRETRFGRMLRQTGLDELPQLWNVFRGEMSLVGPRPLPRLDVQETWFEQHPEYRARWEKRQSILPGVTGLWQVRPSNRFLFEEMLTLDCAYADQRSIKTDLSILWRTFSRAFLR
jgi:lipopolysaccharide/colanic/teichoic acid biosynthesis glycosyltransferase